MLAPILSAYPHGTSANTSDVSNYNVEANAIDNEDAGMVRLDQHFSDRTTAFVRFNMDHAEDAFPAGALSVTSNANTIFRKWHRRAVARTLAVSSERNKVRRESTDYHTVNVSTSPLTVNVSGFQPVGREFDHRCRRQDLFAFG